MDFFPRVFLGGLTECQLANEHVELDSSECYPCSVWMRGDERRGVERPSADERRMCVCRHSTGIARATSLEKTSFFINEGDFDSVVRTA